MADIEEYAENHGALYWMPNGQSIHLEIVGEVFEDEGCWYHIPAFSQWGHYTLGNSRIQKQRPGDPYDAHDMGAEQLCIARPAP